MRSNVTEFVTYILIKIGNFSNAILFQQVSNDQLPRDNNNLHLLLRMLSLGLSAWSMIDSQEFTETKLQPEVVTR